MGNEELMRTQLKRLECYAGGRIELCRAAGIALRTYDRHKAEPWRFMLGELTRLGHYAKEYNLEWDPLHWIG